MKSHYVFEAHSIQDYILSGHKLREMVGASALVEDLCKKGLQEVLDKLNLKKIQFARRGGGAFWAVLEESDDADLLRDIWSLYVRHKAPGLSFTHAIVREPIDDRIDERVETALRAARASPPFTLPAGSPFARHNPLTGLPATALNRDGKRALDEASKIKQDYAHSTDHSLEEKLDLKNDRLVWPKALIAKKGGDWGDALVSPAAENSYVGIIHADGNGLGRILHQVKEWSRKHRRRFADIRADFSKNLDDAARSAAKSATEKNLIQHCHGSKTLGKLVVPARFLVLGGDDLTMVVKAEHAIPFLKDFLEEFSEKSNRFFQGLFGEIGVAKDFRLTASAGIAFVSANQPFRQAYALADSLCRLAKDRVAKAVGDGRPIPSAIAFHRVTSSMLYDWEAIERKELTTRENKKLTMQPYLLNPDLEGFARIGELEHLAGTLQRLSRGSVRELARLLHQGQNQIKPILRRIRQNLEKDKPDLLREFENELIGLNGTPEDLDLPLFDRKGRTPLADALALNSIGYPYKGE